MITVLGWRWRRQSLSRYIPVNFGRPRIGTIIHRKASFTSVLVLLHQWLILLENWRSLNAHWYNLIANCSIRGIARKHAFGHLITRHTPIATNILIISDPKRASRWNLLKYQFYYYCDEKSKCNNIECYKILSPRKLIKKLQQKQKNFSALYAWTR